MKYQNKILSTFGYQYFCSTVLFRTGKIYYLQVFLEECNYVVKEKKIPKYIIDDIENFYDFDKEKSDEQN